MARATIKKDLIDDANNIFDKLILLINSMSEEMQMSNFLFDLDSAGKEAHWKRDRNIRDVLIHLHEWHLLLLNWIKSNLNEENKSFLPEIYNWKTYGEMNIVLWNKHQGTPYIISKEQFMQSHLDVMNLINRFSNDELFSKGKFSWTGTTTLGSYCISATSSHYDWAIKKIKKHINALQLK